MIEYNVRKYVRREFKLRSYTLNFVSLEFLGEQKEDVHHSLIPVLFNGTPDDRKRLAVYCMKDSYLPQRMMDKKMMLVNSVEIARVTGVPFAFLLPRGQQIKTLSKLYRKANVDNVLVPYAYKVPDQGKYEGAIVRKPIVGFYNEPIPTLDFASLYPSIMQAHNLCYTTLIGKLKDALALGFVQDVDFEVTPTGDAFAKPCRAKGILPAILTDLLSARKRAKQLLAAEKDPAKKQVYDARQLALKICANSVYGFTGAQVGKLPCLPIAASVTGYGRQMIELTKATVEAYYTKANGYPVDCQVIYGDTDSVMCKFGAPDVATAMKWGKEAAAMVTKLFIAPISLEFEKVYFPYLLISKKRYAGVMWMNPNKYFKVDTKGLESVRRDNCPLVKAVQSGCINKILLEKDVPGAVAMAKKAVSDIFQNKYDAWQFIISKGLSKGAEEYKAKQAHVELADKIRRRTPDIAPNMGDRVPFVVIKGVNKARLFEQVEDPIYAIEHGLPLDYDYYINRQFNKPLTRVFKSILKDPRRELFAGSHTMKKIITTPSMSAGGIMGFVQKTETCLGCRCPIAKNDVVGGGPICSACISRWTEVKETKRLLVADIEVGFEDVLRECQLCSKVESRTILCQNRDCHVFYKRLKVKKDLEEARDVYEKFLRVESEELVFWSERNAVNCNE